MQNWSYKSDLIVYFFISVSLAVAQPAVEYLGLGDKPISSLAIWEEIIAVGSGGDGVYYQFAFNLPDSAWINIGLSDKNVTAVYPHKVGPFGWGIAAGIFPEEADSNYVYCSHMGGEFFPNSLGFSDSLARGVYSLDGFPDQTICGEKYAATGGALYVQLFGDTIWTPVYESLGVEGEGVICVKTAVDVGGLVLAGGSEGFTGILLIKSTDYGATWDYLYPPGSVIAFDFSYDSTLTDFETIFVSHGYQISRSLDGGETWDIAFNGNGLNFSNVVYDSDVGYVFIAGNDVSDTSSAVIYFSPDVGESWHQIALNLTGPVVDLALSSTEYLYFAIPHSGVYRLSMAELSVESEQIPKSFFLGQNHPNPFNPITTIQYELPQRSEVQITIYDLLGRQVTTLVSETQNAGYKSIKWDATNISSGMYFYQIRVYDSDVVGAGKYVQTRKMVLLR